MRKEDAFGHLAAAIGFASYGQMTMEGQAALWDWVSLGRRVKLWNKAAGEVILLSIAGRIYGPEVGERLRERMDARARNQRKFVTASDVEWLTETLQSETPAC